jgi:hypothetical protein
MDWLYLCTEDYAMYHLEHAHRIVCSQNH